MFDMLTNELVILNDKLEGKPFKESQGKKANKSVILSTILQNITLWIFDKEYFQERIYQSVKNTAWVA